MISLYMAKKLKESGLQWKPQLGDRFCIPITFVGGKYLPKTMIMDRKMMKSYQENEPEDNWQDAIERYVWMPSLANLLTEIEKHGWYWELAVDNLDKPPYCMTIEKGKAVTRYLTYFMAESPEDAAAQALIWILEQTQTEGTQEILNEP